MTNEFQSFQRKTFGVRAARVSPLNIEELAKECGGKVMDDGDKEGHLSRQYIKVRVQYPLNDRQTQAHIGDWLVKQGRNYKVYQDKPFRNTFEHPDGTPVVSEPPKKHAPVPSPASMPKRVETPAPEQSMPMVKDIERVPDKQETLSADEIARLDHIANGGTPEPAQEDKSGSDAGEVAAEVATGNPVEESNEPQTAEGTPTEEVSEASVFQDVASEEKPWPEVVTENSPGGDSDETSDVQHDQDVAQEEIEKKSITLDELNEMPGDPRSAQEIMNER